MVAAGLPDNCAAHTIDTQCCSGLDAAAMAVGLLQSGQAEVVIAGGIEAWYTNVVDPEYAFHVLITAKSIIYAMAGGFGTILGPVVGTAALLGGESGDRIVLRAPRDGVVAQMQANLGMVAEPGAALFAVGNAKSLGLVAHVFEMDLPNIKVGSTARVELPVRTEAVQAKVQQVGAVVDAESRRAPILLSLQGQGVQESLRAGMQARVGITVDRPAQMMVPIGAVLIKDESTTVVFVQTADNTFEARKVSLGLPVRGWVPVISGLKDGERIVVRGALMLDGAASQML